MRRARSSRRRSDPTRSQTKPVRKASAVGGAAYLVSKAIRASRVVAFGDLGMEAIYEFEVKDMPVTVAVDARGESVHETGPAEWRGRIKGIPVTTAVQ